MSSTPYIGEIRMFAFAETPVGWIPCDGTELPSNAYTELFLLLKNTFGGDGVTTFRVPDLRGRTPVHVGVGRALTPRARGDTGGFEAVGMGQMPTHSHSFSVASTVATERQPGPTNVIGALSGDTAFVDNTATGTREARWKQAAVSFVGKGVPHENCMPTLTLNFCIAGVGRSVTA